MPLLTSPQPPQAFVLCAYSNPDILIGASSSSTTAWITSRSRTVYAHAPIPLNPQKLNQGLIHQPYQCDHCRFNLMPPPADRPMHQSLGGHPVRCQIILHNGSDDINAPWIIKSPWKLHTSPLNQSRQLFLPNTTTLSSRCSRRGTINQRVG